MENFNPHDPSYADFDRFKSAKNIFDDEVRNLNSQYLEPDRKEEENNMFHLDNQMLRGFFMHLTNNQTKINRIDPRKTMGFISAMVEKQQRALAERRAQNMKEWAQKGEQFENNEELELITKSIAPSDPNNKEENDPDAKIKAHLKHIEEMKKNDPIYKEQRMKDYAYEIRQESMKYREKAVQYDVPQEELDKMSQEAKEKEERKQNKLKFIEDMKTELIRQRDMTANLQSELYNCERQQQHIQDEHFRLKDEVDFQIFELKSRCAKLEYLTLLSQKQIKPVIDEKYQNMTVDEQTDLIRELQEKNDRQMVYLCEIDQEIEKIKKEFMTFRPDQHVEIDYDTIVNGEVQQQVENIIEEEGEDVEYDEGEIKQQLIDIDGVTPFKRSVQFTDNHQQQYEIQDQQQNKQLIKEEDQGPTKTVRQLPNLQKILQAKIPNEPDMKFIEISKTSTKRLSKLKLAVKLSRLSKQEGSVTQVKLVEEKEKKELTEKLIKQREIFERNIKNQKNNQEYLENVFRSMNPDGILDGPIMHKIKTLKEKIDKDVKLLQGTMEEKYTASIEWKLKEFLTLKNMKHDLRAYYINHMMSFYLEMHKYHEKENYIFDQAAYLKMVNEMENEFCSQGNSSLDTSLQKEYMPINNLKDYLNDNSIDYTNNSLNTDEFRPEQHMDMGLFQFLGEDSVGGQATTDRDFEKVASFIYSKFNEIRNERFTETNTCKVHLKDIRPAMNMGGSNLNQKLPILKQNVFNNL